MKAGTIITTHEGKTLAKTGESVLCVQGNKKGEGIRVNINWSFDPNWTMDEIKSMLAGFLGNIEDVFGEKMVTEMISHWGVETGKLVKTSPTQAIIYTKSHGQKFKHEN